MGTPHITKKSSITFVELPATEFGELLTTESNGGKLSPDVYHKFNLPLRACHSLEAVLRAQGFENVQSINPLYHGDNGCLTNKNLSRIFDSAFVGISTISRTSKQSAELVRRVKEVNPRGIVALGGPHFSYRIEEGLSTGADVIFIGEGERTLKEFMNRMIVDAGNYKGIKGIAFNNNGEIEINEERKLLTPAELNELPHPFYDAVTREKVGAAVLQTSRGCPWGCNFCIVSKMNGKRYRRQSVDYAVEGLEQVGDMGKSIFYLDDNLAGDSKGDLEHCEEFLEAIVDRGLGREYSIAQVSVNVAKHPKFLRLAKDAGISLLCVGVESFNDESLIRRNKPANSKKNKEALETFLDYGFLVHGMMMPWEDDESLDALDYELECAKRFFHTVQFFPTGPIPGTPFAEEMESQGRILTDDYSFGSGDYVMVQPSNFSAYDFQIKVREMYEGFYSDEHARKIRADPKVRKSPGLLLIYRNIRNGVKGVLESDQMNAHLEFLKGV